MCLASPFLPKCRNLSVMFLLGIAFSFSIEGLEKDLLQDSRLRMKVRPLLSLNAPNLKVPHFFEVSDLIYRAPAYSRL